MRTNYLFIAIIPLLMACEADAQPAVTRGPYLLMGTPNSVVVRWRTDSMAAPVDSRVWYGTQLDTSSMQTIDDQALTGEHEINITGLTPNTKYYYIIATTTALLGSPDSTYYFKTPPPAGTSQPVRICAIGDFGEGNQGAVNIKNGYLNYLNGRHADAWLWLGDNAYDDGRDSDYQTKVFDVYPEVFKNTILYPSPGNHDYGKTHPVISLGAGPYYANFTMPANGECGGVPSGTEAYYSFDYGNIHFVSLNSEEYAYAINLDLSITIDHDPAMLAWLENDLAANSNKDWIIAYLHQPPYSRGTHTETDASIGYYDGAIMRAVRDYIIPILESYGADLVLNGHSHTYERSYLLYGNYGPDSPYPIDSTIVDGGTGSTSDGTPYLKFTTGSTPNRGTVYAVVGCSSKTGNLTSDGQLDHPLMYAGGYEGGSMVIEVNGMQLDAFLVDSVGAVYDDFTIIKYGTVANSAPVANSDTVSTDAGTTVQIYVQLNDSDPNGDPMTVSIASGPGNGSATVVGDTLISYTPDPGFTGTDTVMYSLCDNGTPPLCDTATVIIHVLPDSISGIFDRLKTSRLSVFPNPFRQQLTLEYALYDHQDVSLDIYDLDGKKVYSVVHAYQSPGMYSYVIDGARTGLIPGAYLLRYETGGTLRIRKTIRL